MKKSSVEQIKQRFDNDVERFSSLETGQVAAVDSVLALEILTEASKRIVPNATDLLDVGCGAGNFSVKLLEKVPSLNVTLNDLSEPMLDKANERVSALTEGSVTTVQGDIRDVELADDSFDIILAGAVLHHLRDDADWQSAFSKLYRVLKPGGCLMISDLVTQEIEPANEYMWQRYANYLDDLGGEAYRNTVLEYIDEEDSPRSVVYQLDLMKNVGFTTVDIFHKNSCFAVFGGVK